VGRLDPDETRARWLALGEEGALEALRADREALFEPGEPAR